MHRRGPSACDHWPWPTCDIWSKRCGCCLARRRWLSARAAVMAVRSPLRSRLLICTSAETVVDHKWKPVAEVAAWLWGLRRAVAGIEEAEENDDSQGTPEWAASAAQLRRRLEKTMAGPSSVATVLCDTCEELSENRAWSRRHKKKGVGDTAPGPAVVLFYARLRLGAVQWVTVSGNQACI